MESRLVAWMFRLNPKGSGDDRERERKIVVSIRMNDGLMTRASGSGHHNTRLSLRHVGRAKIGNPHTLVWSPPMYPYVL